MQQSCTCGSVRGHRVTGVPTATKIAFQSLVLGRFLANDRGYPEAEANR